MILISSRLQGRKSTDVVEITKELELGLEPEYVTELLQPHDKLVTDEEWLLTDEQRNWYLEMESTAGGGEDC